MSTLSVGDLQGLAVNSNVVTVPTGHTLNVTDAGGLQIGGSAVVSAGLVLISQTTIGSAVSSVTVTDAFSADFNNYLIVYKIDAASTTAGFLCEFGVGGTITTTGYYESRLTVNSSGVVSGVAQNNVAYLDLNSVVATTGGAGSFQVFRPYVVAKTGTASVGTDMRTGGGFLRLANGWQDSTTQFTSFRLSPTTGTLTGGEVSLYGYAKA